jgi:hypothetical protein
MKYSTSITTIFNTSLERAFKSPMLCDISQVHTGYLMTPKVTHCTKDETWGKIGGSRVVHAAKNIFFPKGLVSLDSVVERKENEYWKIQITNFSQWMLGIYTFEGEWITKPHFK